MSHRVGEEGLPVDEARFGRYQLITLIGEGGMGKVYKAHDTVIGRDVALKVLPAELGSQPGYRERFRREAHTAARLTEPHIIPIHDTGEVDGHLYLVMPVIEGVDVETLLRREGPMSPQRAVHVIEQLAAALTAAHARGLVHRDIKPSNALMTADDFVYLIDFGIAHDAAASRLTSTGMMVGTMSYMAPERFTGGTADARADVYSLACVLHECLTGVAPFPGDSVEQQIAGHLTLDPPKPSRINPAVPAGFDSVIAAGMAKKPDERYQNARELATAARRALTEVPAAIHNPRTAPTLFGDHRPAPVPVTEPVWQPAGQQRPPDRPAVLTPADAPARSSRSRVVIAAAAVVSAVGLAVAASFITMQLLKPHSSASRTPIAQPPPSAQSAQPAPPAAGPPPTSSTGVPGMAPFVGIWQAHTQRIVIDNAGTGHLMYEGCTACTTQTQNNLDFTLTSVTNGIAHGSITASSDAGYQAGQPVTATVTAGSPGQLLEMTVNGLMMLPLCNNAAEATGQCGA